MLQTTPARVAGPFAPAAAEEALPDEEMGWVPGDLPRAVQSRRTYRIPVVVLAIATAVGLYFGAGALLNLPLAHAESSRSAYREVLTETLDAVPGFRAAAADLTSGAETGAGAPATGLANMEGLAADLREAATRPDPVVIPGLPAGDLDHLDPIRSRIGGIAERITAIGVVVTDVSTYRTAMDAMFVLPELPGPDEGPSVEVFSDRLSLMTAATVEAAALLPDGDLFSAHRAAVAELVAWLPDWQASYVESLRDDDLAAADTLRAEAVARIDRLHDELDGLLSEAATWADEAITGLVFEIQAALLLTG